MVGLGQRHLVAGDGVIEIPIPIRLQIHVKRVIVGIRDRIVVEVLVKVGFAIVVQIVQPGDLVAA